MHFFFFFLTGKQTSWDHIPKLSPIISYPSIDHILQTHIFDDSELRDLRPMPMFKAVCPICRTALKGTSIFMSRSGH